MLSAGAARTDSALGELERLRAALAEVAGLGYTAASREKALHAFDAMHKALMRLCTEDGLKFDSDLESIEPKRDILAFLADVTRTKPSLRSRVAAVERRLLALHGWREAAPVGASEPAPPPCGAALWPLAAASVEVPAVASAASTPVAAAAQCDDAAVPAASPQALVDPWAVPAGPWTAPADLRAAPADPWSKASASSSPVRRRQA
ncbi:unnamed protein product, partial [Prorocentrum cordatum]